MEQKHGTMPDKHVEQNGKSTSDSNSKKQEKQWFNFWKSKEKEEETKQPPALPPVPYHKLFMYATRTDIGFIVVAILAAMGTGILMPLLIILYGEFTEVLVESELNSTTTSVTNIFIPKGDIRELDFMQSVAYFGIICCSLGVAQLLLDYIFVACLNYTSEKQILRIRKVFLQQVLRQDIGWYDTHQTGDFASRLTEDLIKLHDGIGEKLGMFIFQSTSFVTSIIIAFVYGWQLTLVVLCCMPFLIISTFLVIQMQTTLTERELQAYASAGSICEEVLSSIRTVMAFGGEKKESARYSDNLIPARRTALKRGVYTGIGNGIMWFFTFGTYSLAFWYGVTLVIEGRGQEDPAYTPATLAIVFFCVLYSAMVMGQSAPFIESFSVARGAAANIFALIDRQSKIDSLSDEGEKPNNVDGDISFTGVTFNYPSRTEVAILNGLNLHIRRGETVALVGASGCGKSTCLQLIQRFYDPLEGEVKLDGRDLKSLNVSWLRSQIGVVGQEPVLFDASIEENIRQGLHNATFDEIRAAAREAQADDFIMKLPKQYDTLVGERGAQLSGGQKQRIAIARALIRKPAILLLDEATSALDTNSEAQVQQALDQASKGRTTIIVAHRLTTVRSADRIVVISDGRVVEDGTHHKLLAQKGIYYELVVAQTKSLADDGEDMMIQGPQENLPDTVTANHDRRTSQNSRSSYRGSLATSHNKLKDHDFKVNSTDEDDGEIEAPMSRILKLNKPEWKEITVGCIGAFIVGCSMPAFAVLFGDIYGVLSLPDPEDVREGANFYSVLFLITGVVTGIGAYFQTYMFNLSGCKMTMRLREQSFTAILRQEPAWFDDQRNSTGALCARLSGDAASVQGATGTRVGVIIQTITTLSLGLGLALYFSWKLGLVTAAFVPIVFIAMIFESRATRAQSVDAKKALEAASKVATESISNIRTVAGLVREKAVIDQYYSLLNEPHQNALRTAHIRGFAFGLGQSMPFFAYGLSLYYGGYLVYYENLPYENIIKVTEALLYGTMMLGQVLAFAPDFNQAKIAAYKIIKLLERKPQIYDTSFTKLNKDWRSKGDVEYRNVQFAYPTRPHDLVLRDLTFNAQKGQTVALVGASGCGKSTCLQLLQRFYDPASGSISIDENEVSSLPICLLREQLGIVSQEPVLFDRTLADNIAYGDNNRDVPMDEVISAARQANIHSFITALPLGYETRLGERGAQLSGGQKQRVAIARALVRNPRVLLLDEATSALDAESEKVVQAALDGARKGRTCIVIAHRLSTIQDADVICVVNRGRIVESGRHTELLAKRGAYYRLHTQQTS